MELQDIFSLMDRFERSSLQSLSLSHGAWSLTMGKGGAAAAAPMQEAATAGQSAPVQVPAQGDGREALIRAPLLGTFYLAGEPGGTPFVKPGDQVKKGQTLCVLEAMKTLSELPAPMDCTVLELLLEDGALAEYDAPLFRVLPADRAEG